MSDERGVSCSEGGCAETPLRWLDLPLDPLDAARETFSFPDERTEPCPADATLGGADILVNCTADCSGSAPRCFPLSLDWRNAADVVFASAELTALRLPDGAPFLLLFVVVLAIEEADESPCTS